MRLRRQLFLLGLVTLALPVAAWLYLVDLESRLRATEGNAIAMVGAALAGGLGGQSGPAPASSTTGTPLLVTEGERIAVDGSLIDWAGETDRWQQLDLGEYRLELAMNDFGAHSYLAATVSRRDGSAIDAPLFQLSSADGGGETVSYPIATGTPGPFIAAAQQQQARRNIYGHVERGGDTLRWEARLPRRPDNQTLRLMLNGDAVELRLLRGDPGRATALNRILPPGFRAWLTSPEGWVLAQSFNHSATPPGDQLPWLHGWFQALIYRHLIAPSIGAGTPLATPRFRIPPQAPGNIHWLAHVTAGTTVARLHQPLVGGGWLVLERESASLVRQTVDGFFALMTTTGLTLLLIAVTLVGYAGWLSRRIRRLSRAARRASDDGDNSIQLPGVTARDELGDLARGLQTALNDIRGYNQYLRTLADKLAHELRTPVAVVRGSLDNLAPFPLPAEAEPFVQRAKDGADRLRRMLQALSEARQLEQAIAAESPEPCDLAEVVSGVFAGYRQIHPDFDWQLHIGDGDYRQPGLPDLVAQALEKLIDNAVGFTPEGKRIALFLDRHDDAVRIRLENHGPALPARMREHLFDSLVSMREDRGDQPHLGLGLYIARLVAERHGGGIAADDLPDGRGVVFTLTLPALRLPRSTSQTQGLLT